MADRKRLSAYDLPEPIQWHEGMLLAPQHLQQQALRQESLVTYHAHLISPFHWGVRHLRIDPVLLVDGELRILELEAVMPDGLVVSTVRQQLDGLSVDLAAHQKEMTDAPLKIHLAVAARRGAGEPVKGSLSRFSSVDGDPVADENTGSGDLRIPRLRPRAHLLVGETPPEKYDSFPLAEVAYANETFELTRYTPPMLAVDRRSPLGETSAHLASRLRERAVYLAEKVRSPSVAARAPQLLETKGRAGSLVAALPHFEALVQSSAIHPFQLYLALCQLAGHLASLGTALVPPVFDPYDHNDLQASFDQVKNFVDRVLTEGFIETYDAFPFVLDKDVFTLKFDSAWEARRLIIGVRARSGASEGQVAAWLEHSLIGSESRMTSMRQRRVLGLQRREFVGEADLVPTAGVRLYAVTWQPEFLEADQPLMIFNPDESESGNRPAEIVLYVKRPDTPNA